MAKLSNKEIKQQIAKLTGWETTKSAGRKSSEYERNYDIYRNKFRNYENTFGTSVPQPVNVQLLRTARKAYSYGLRQGLSVEATKQYVTDVIRGRKAMPELTTRERAIVTGSTVSTGQFMPTAEQMQAAYNVVLKSFARLIETHPELAADIKERQEAGYTPHALREFLEVWAVANRIFRKQDWESNKGPCRYLSDVPSP